jgi:hypothetical protein
MGKLLDAVRKAVAPSTKCGWCGEEVPIKTGFRQPLAWFCSEDHAAEDQKFPAM